MAADEVERAVMRASELIALELLVGFEREVAIGIEHELDALAQFFIAQKQRIGGGLGFSHGTMTIEGSAPTPCGLGATIVRRRTAIDLPDILTVSLPLFALRIGQIERFRQYY